MTEKEELLNEETIDTTTQEETPADTTTKQTEGTPTEEPRELTVEEKLAEAEAKIEELLVARKNYADTLIIASEESRRKELHLQYDAICKETNEKEERKNALSAVFPNGIPKDEEFEEILHIAHEMKALESAMNSMELTSEEVVTIYL